jgi:ketosteroid isomerase-like protein
VAVRHVDMIERVFELSNRCAAGDMDALAELVRACHQDTQLDLPGAAADERGEAAVRDCFRRVCAFYQEWECVLDYVQDYGDRVLALGALRFVPAGGAEHEDAVGWIFTFRDDRIQAVKAYPSYGDALRAVTTRTPLGHVKTP